MSMVSGHTDPPTVFVVEDDPDAARFVCRALERRGYGVRLFCHPELALAAMKGPVCSLLLSDVRLPGLTGLELLVQARKVSPQLPIVLMTAFATLDDTIVALRNGADDYLLKPLAVDSLCETIEKVLKGRRSRRRRVLAIGAHPDDVEIGVGATLVDHVERGDEVTILTLTHGESGGPASDRAAEARSAAELVRAHLILGTLRDTSIPPNGLTVDLIEEVVKSVKPTVVYTHSLSDVHQDHRAAHQASLVACRGVPQIFGYQSPSATVDFAPRRFVPVDQFIERKLGAIAAYRTQTTKCSYLAEELLRATARYWGRFVESEYAEPLEVIREQARVAGGLTGAAVAGGDEQARVAGGLMGAAVGGAGQQAQVTGRSGGADLVSVAAVARGGQQAQVAGQDFSEFTNPKESDHHVLRFV